MDTVISVMAPKDLGSGNGQLSLNGSANGQQPETIQGANASAPALRSPLKSALAIPDDLLQRVSASLRPVFKVLFGRPPIVAGQDPAGYFALLDTALVEYTPRSFDELSLVKRMVDEDWRILFLQEIRAAVFNATIAAKIADQLTDIEAELSEQAMSNCVQTGEAQQRRTKQLALRAIAGDILAAATVEEKLGPSIGATPEISPRLAQSVGLLSYLDRAIAEATTRRDTARREFVKARAERMQRRHLTLEEVRNGLLESEFLKLCYLIKEGKYKSILGQNLFRRQTDANPDQASVPAPRDNAVPSIAPQEQADNITS